MNNPNSKIKWLVWAIVILFLMNAATLATILYNNYKQRVVPDTTIIANSFSGNTINGRFFRQTLGFTNEQMEIFGEANQQFRPQTTALMIGIDSVKNEMFNEMKKQQADTVMLNRFSKEIGDLHGELKQETYRFYLKLRSVCSDLQRSQLEKAFEPLFKSENFSAAPHRFQRGWNKANN